MFSYFLVLPFLAPLLSDLHSPPQGSGSPTAAAPKGLIEARNLKKPNYLNLNLLLPFLELRLIPEGTTQLHKTFTGTEQDGEGKQ